MKKMKTKWVVLALMFVALFYLGCPNESIGSTGGDTDEQVVALNTLFTATTQADADAAATTLGLTEYKHVNKAVYIDSLTTAVGNDTEKKVALDRFKKGDGTLVDYALIFPLVQTAITEVNATVNLP